MMRTRDGVSPVWSTYTFANWITDDAVAWHEVRSAISGGRILMANGTELPQVVRPIGLVDRWLSAADDDMVVPELVPAIYTDDWGWLAGRTVRLPLVDLCGRVVRVERDWAVVLTELLGRPQMIRKQCALLLPVEDEWVAPKAPKPRRRGYLRMRR